MVINLPLLATISCNKSSTSTEKPTLTNKKGTLSLTGLFDSNTDVNTAKKLINSKWIFDNKYKLFENPELLTSYDSITDIKVFESGTTIVLSFKVDSQEFEFVILGFLNPNYEQARLTIKNNTVFDRKLFTGIDNIEDINEAIKSINEQWLKTHKSIIFNNDHLITDKTSITVKADVRGTIITVQAIISSEIYNFFISGFTNSIISGNNRETIVFPLITNDSFSQKWAHLESYSNDQVKAFIESNKNTIFHNLHNETTIVSIGYTYRIVDGTIEAKIKLGGKVYDREGKLVNADSNKEYQVSLIGFKTTDLTTYLSSEELNIKEISSLSSKKASEIISNIDSNNEELKNKIKDLIKNPTLGQEIQTTSDIQITTKIENANDAKGTLDLEVTIKNNKAWKDGVKEDNKKFNLKLTGFKIQAPTTIANFEIKNLIDAKIKDKYAIPYGNWNGGVATTRTGTENDEQANEKLLKTELEKHVKSIFNNEPEDVTIKEVKINKDYTIGSIQNGYDAAHGAVYIVVTLNKYYDENGKLITTTSSHAKDDNKGKFYFKVTGFKVDEKMTTYLDYASLYDDTTNNAIRLTPDIYTEQASNANSSFFQSSFEKLILKKLTLKQEPSSGTVEKTEEQPEQPTYTLDKIKNKVYGDSNWTSKNEISPSAPTKQVNEKEEELINKIKEHIYIDWKNNNIIADDTRGILTLEVTFKNVWWKNGVLIKEHKEVMRFSGFREIWTKPMYNPDLLIVEEEVVQKNGTTTKEKVAVTSNQTISQINLEEIVKEEVIKNKTIVDESTKKKIIEKIKSELEKYIANNAIDLIVGVRDYSSIKVENVNINDSLDTVSFTLLINNEKFNFKCLGFLGKNNKANPSSHEALTQGATEQKETNSNNNIATQDNFEFKWVGHSYSDSEGIKDPQFYGHYWYSFEITIKDDVNKENALIDKNTSQAFYDKIKDNKLSDFYLLKDNLEIIPYEIVDNKNNSITIKFKHEEWSSIDFLVEEEVEKQSQAESEPTKPPYYLAVSNLGSFDFEKIFFASSSTEIAQEPLQQPTYKEEVLLNPSIFAAEFVKDNYDQYGSIKLKGYDLPIDIDQYDFWYKDEASQEFKELDKSKANIVEKYEAQVEGSEKVNVFVKIQFSLEETEKLPENAKLYVSLKSDKDNHKHLIKL